MSASNTGQTPFTFLLAELPAGFLDVDNVTLGPPLKPPQSKVYLNKYLQTALRLLRSLNQMFVVPNNRPKANDALFNALLVFGALTVETTDIKLKDQTLQFSVKRNSSLEMSSWSVVYLSHQNLPVVEKIKNVKTAERKVTSEA
ncbi:hypothetical protein B0A50_05879 [Salinomyces thailandicus]|uniref:Uncharacterized protein n=1 Tax=Salinomyces thailandicus TaxID=706561 RepID=A0A4U0TSH9_9PEZI|nr:hypothetical protein B0A50_05879 [Salinomyces thailandica]